jgi:hypothetical protein
MNMQTYSRQMHRSKKIAYQGNRLVTATSERKRQVTKKREIQEIAKTKTTGQQ